MRRAFIAAAAALITLLSACSSSSDDSSSSTTADVADAEAAAGIPPAPDQATTDAYIAALDAINPGIVHRGADDGDIEIAVDRGRNACSTILDDPADRARQIASTNQRFTAPDAPDGWGPEVAEQILDVVHQHLCPDA